MYGSYLLVAVGFVYGLMLFYHPFVAITGAALYLTWRGYGGTVEDVYIEARWKWLRLKQIIYSTVLWYLSVRWDPFGWSRMFYVDNTAVLLLWAPTEDARRRIAYYYKTAEVPALAELRALLDGSDLPDPDPDQIEFLLYWPAAKVVEQLKISADGSYDKNRVYCESDPLITGYEHGIVALEDITLEDPIHDDVA